ncbi:glycosyltransferase family 2 protein [bacterium]|nr:MAG: glycosyltransferase family 2 protein [bacterium]
MKPYLSIIIPAYNEADRIEASLQKAVDYLGQKDYEYEIIVADDGSTDNTVAIANKFGDKVKAYALPKNTGKGAAVRMGMLKAKGDIRIFTDADFSTPIYEIEKIVYSLKNNFDIVIGSRALDYGMVKEHQPFYREFMGKMFNKFVQLLVIKGIKDTQCGFKGFTEEAAINIFSKAKIDGFSFDVEALYLANKAGYRIDEVPVEWYNDDRSKVNPITDSIKMLIEIMRIKKIHNF